MSKSRIEGMDKLEKAIRKLGTLPQKCVNKAARKGAVIPRKSAKQGGWIDQSGNLRKGIIIKAEKTTVKGKKVYQVTMDSKMNDIFQKKTMSGLRVFRRGTKSKMAEGNYYYPASQEYGFRARNGKYIPGFHFMKNALESNSGKIEKVIVEELSKEIDKL